MSKLREQAQQPRRQHHCYHSPPYTMNKDNEIEVHLTCGPHTRIPADKKRTFRDFELENGEPSSTTAP